MDKNNSKHIRLLTVRQKMVLASVALGLVAGVGQFGLQTSGLRKPSDG